MAVGRVEEGIQGVMDKEVAVGRVEEGIQGVMDKEVVVGRVGRLCVWERAVLVRRGGGKLRHSRRGKRARALHF